MFLFSHRQGYLHYQAFPLTKELKQKGAFAIYENPNDSQSNTRRWFIRVIVLCTQTNNTTIKKTTTLSHWIRGNSVTLLSKGVTCVTPTLTPTLLRWSRDNPVALLSS